MKISWNYRNKRLHMKIKLGLCGMCKICSALSDKNTFSVIEIFRRVWISMKNFSVKWSPDAGSMYNKLSAGKWSILATKIPCTGDHQSASLDRGQTYAFGPVTCVTCWLSYASGPFNKEVNWRLAKRPLVFNGRLANRQLTPLVIEATGVRGHGDVMTWKRFPHCWPFVRGIHRRPVDFPHKGASNGEWCFLCC